MLNINIADFKKMLLGGAKLLDVNKNYVDSLNVFPVPDGDTGTNMSLTLSSAVKEVNACTSDRLEDLATAFSKGTLRGARGNSGVITSQIMKGFAIAAVDKNEFNAADFAYALKKGTEIAYGAVTRPKEGTMLTVIRAMAEKAQSITKRKKIEIEPFLEEVIAYGEEILNKTPEMLPVLKKAGVVDAGGQGLIFIYKGFYNALADIEIPDEAQEHHITEISALDNLSADDHEHINFSYCTEFFIIHIFAKSTVADIDKLRDFLMTIGDCVLVIGDLEFIKVHVHTNNPDLALKAALKIGELDSIKIENMVEQNRAILEKKEKEEAEKNAELKEIGLISICSGKGMEEIFNDLGVDIVVEGGQTMNPSVYDILTAINNVKAKNVLIFPNNKNIILAAEQAKGLAEKNVYVIPTVNVAQGIAAIVSYMPEDSIEEIVETMKNSFSHVKCGQVTKAVRSTRMNGFSLKEGDLIGLDDKKIVAKGNEINDVVKHTIEKIKGDDVCVITLYYGEEVNEEDASILAEELATIYPDYEILYYSGGQPHYYYLFSIE